MICKSIKSLTHTSYSSVRTRFVSSPLTRKTFLMSLVWCSTLPQAYTCYCAFYKMETSIFASEYPTRQFLKSTFLSLCSWTGVWFNGSNCPTQLNNTEMYCEDLAAVCSSDFFPTEPLYLTCALILLLLQISETCYSGPFKCCTPYLECPSLAFFSW